MCFSVFPFKCSESVIVICSVSLWFLIYFICYYDPFLFGILIVCDFSYIFLLISFARVLQFDLSHILYKSLPGSSLKQYDPPTRHLVWRGFIPLYSEEAKLLAAHCLSQNAVSCSLYFVSVHLVQATFILLLILTLLSSLYVIFTLYVPTAE